MSRRLSANGGQKALVGSQGKAQTTTEVREELTDKFVKHFNLRPDDPMKKWLDEELVSHRELIKVIKVIGRQIKREYEEGSWRTDESREQMRLQFDFDEDPAASILSYFEVLRELADLEPKTKLMNFIRFKERLELILALKDMGQWCAIGFADGRDFKWYNDALSYAVGDRVIQQIAELLREHVRSADLMTHKSEQDRLLSRFGGDEYCFVVPDLDDYNQAQAIGERFREAVARFDWTTEDQRLSVKPPQVDVGVVCLWLGPVAERHMIAKRLTEELIHRADELMKVAKRMRADHVNLMRVKLVNGQLVEISDDSDVLSQ